MLTHLQDEIAEKAVRLTAREKRFIKFASVEYDGQIYCTPQDFLESVVEQEPRPRLKVNKYSTNLKPKLFFYIDFNIDFQISEESFNNTWDQFLEGCHARSKAWICAIVQIIAGQRWYLK